MSIKIKIIKAQTVILNTLVNCEEAAAELYAVYSKTFPDLEEFWKELSEKEVLHADLLRKMHIELESGNLFHNIGRFDLASTTSFLEKVRDAIAYAKENPISPAEAINMALFIESSILDAHFYDIVKSDSAEYRAVADRLSTDTHAHVNLVRKQLQNMQSKKSEPTVNTPVESGNKQGKAA